MRIDTLLSPGRLTNAFDLRKEACKAISQVEIQAGYTDGAVVKANELQAFFQDCADLLDDYVDTDTPDVSTRVRTAANTAVITFDKDLDPSTSVPLTSVVFTPSRTVTAIVVADDTMTITATGVIVGDTITYTPPTGADADKGVKDTVGNLAETFTGVLA